MDDNNLDGGTPGAERAGDVGRHEPRAPGGSGEFGTGSSAQRPGFATGAGPADPRLSEIAEASLRAFADDPVIGMHWLPNGSGGQRVILERQSGARESVNVPVPAKKGMSAQTASRKWAENAGEVRLEIRTTHTRAVMLWSFFEMLERKWDPGLVVGLADDLFTAVCNGLSPQDVDRLAKAADANVNRMELAADLRTYHIQNGSFDESVFEARLAERVDDDGILQARRFFAWVLKSVRAAETHRNQNANQPVPKPKATGHAAPHATRRAHREPVSRRFFSAMRQFTRRIGK